MLAGGKGRRMGGINKSFIRVGETPIIQRTIDLLKGIFEEVLIVTNSPDDYRNCEKDCRVITDRMKDIGPLGGIYTALAETSRPAVFFFACDMPFLHNGLVRRQLACFEGKDCDAMVARIGDAEEPLHGIYRKSLAEPVRRFVTESGSRSVKVFLKTINTLYWDLGDDDRRALVNLNTQEDVSRIGGARCG